MKHTMTQEQVLRYLELVERRLFILTHSGVDWLPEYEQELASIDSEINTLRNIVDAEYESPEPAEPSEDEVAQAIKEAESYDFQAFFDGFSFMSNFAIFTETRHVLEIYDTLQHSTAPGVESAIGSDGFNQALSFLEEYSARCLVDLFFCS